MQLLNTDDTTSLNYWLNWRFFICAIWVFTPIFVAIFMIWKNKSTEESSDLHDDDVWRPCLKQINPVYLLAFRIISFGLLLAAIISHVVGHGGKLFLYYTQWTFSLVTVYFGYASLLSLYGCLTCNTRASIDEEQGLLNKGIEKAKASFSTHLFQILFQTTAGAVMLTDILYWTVCYPFITIQDYDMNFLTVVAHSLNAILLLGDTALNCLRFEWFRIYYFLIWTGLYVIFQWTIHAFVSIWWPYPFLDLSATYSPLWYFLVGFMHFLCYGIFALFVRGKQYALSRWFSESITV